MAVTKTDFIFPSTVGDCDIHGISWRPEGTPKAVVQFVHGMAEYIDRYDEMARYYAEHGIAFYGIDHLGHGQSVNDKYGLGYFGNKNENGYIFVEDQKKVTDLAKAENPGVPLIIYGHSMGSFITRVYISKYGNEVDAAVVCGTAGPNPAIGAALVLTKILNKVRGKKPGKLMNVMAFMGWNNKTDKRTTFDWLSVDEKNVDDYIADPLCGNMFTNNGFRALITLNNYINDEEVYAGTPKDLPIYLIAGSEDPVGGYGKGVEQVKEAYEKSGHTKVTMKLYDGLRHEIHNEACKTEVYDNVIAYIEGIIA